MKRHAALLAVAEVVCLRHQPHELFQELASHLRPVLEFDLVQFALYDPTRRVMKMYFWDELPRSLSPVEVAVKESALATVWRNQTWLQIDDLATEKQFEGLPWLRQRQIRSYSVLPLTNFREKLGAIGFGSKQPRAFSNQDVRFMHRVAELVAICIDTTLADTVLAQEVGRLRLRLERAQIEKDSTREESKPDASPDKMLISGGETQRTGNFLHVLSMPSHDPGSTNDFSLSAPEALMESEQLLTAYFKASKVGLCIVDAHFRYLAINETLAEMNGISAPAHLGKTVREMLGDFAEIIEPQFRRVLATGQPISDFELTFVLPTRSHPGHWIEHYIPIKNAAGEVSQIGVIAVEVTEQKELEKSLHSVSETLRQEKKRQHVLTEVNNLLATKWDMKQVFPRVSAYLRRILRQEYAALSLHEEGSGQLVPQVIDFPLGKRRSAGGEIGAAKGPGSQALHQRAALIFGADEMQGFDPAMSASLNSEGLKSLCCVPLLRPKGPLGVLVLGSTRAEAFHSEDLALLNQVAAQLGVALENAATAREVEQLKQKLRHERRYLEGESSPLIRFEDIIGKSLVLQEVLDQVAVVAASDATVLILGETGTGKGLIARAIHRASKRKDRGFVTLNCAAIPTGLMESELFGHEKGAFTGAVSQKVGRLEVATQGTLFLDEIGEIPLELQPKLLRVLQDFEFERLGGKRTIKVDLRLIAATNRDLARSVAQKEFRSDLFYRLNVFPIRLPSLRERREDIPLLIRYFVKKFSRAMDRDIQAIPSETMEALCNWHWPGNIRELENFIERSVILTDGTTLRAPLAEFRAETSHSKERSLEDTEREHIIRVLRETKGMISGPSGAARRLGLKRTTLQSKMKRLGITPEDYSGRKPN